MELFASWWLNRSGSRFYAVISTRPIAEGEEITVDYGWERGQLFGSKCLCGSENCREWL